MAAIRAKAALLIEAVMPSQSLQGRVEILQACRRFGNAVDAFDQHGPVFLQACALEDSADEGFLHENGVHAAPLCTGAP